MVTDNDANAAEQAASVEVETTETEIEKIKREAAVWQQKFNSSQGRLKQMEIKQAESAESEDRIATFVKEAVESVASGDAPDRIRERIEAAGAKREAARQLSNRVSETQFKLDKLVTEEGIDWETDPDLADARRAWDSAKPEDAFRIASLVARERALKKTHVSEDEVDGIVETKLRNARQADSNVVNNGTSTAPRAPVTNDPRNPQELVAYLRNARNRGTVISKEERARLVRGAGGR
jgi:hypothetical protein